MSILIKGMEMPKNCYECLVRNQGFSGDGMKCGKTGSVLSWYDGNRKRMDDCPLVHVPPHGDLIDKNETIKALWKALYEYEDMTEKQFVESSELDVSDWILHRIFVQNMSDIDRKTILQMTTIIEAEWRET